MSAQSHYSLHHPSVYINPSDIPVVPGSGGAASPVGLLNFSRRHQTRPSSVGADVVGDASAAAGVNAGHRSGGREGAGVVDWEEASTARRFQHQQQPFQPTLRQRDDRQVSHLRLQEKNRPHNADAVRAGEQCGRGSASPPPPPPPPPPVLSAAQQRHLRQIQQQDRLALELQDQRRVAAEHEHGGRVVQHGGGAGEAYCGDERRPAVQHVERLQRQEPQYQRQELQHQPSGQPQQPQHAVLPLPLYGNSVQSAGPQCPSPLVKVPIYKTLSEALHEQQKQQKLLQQRQQSSRHAYPPNLVHSHQAGAISFAAPSPRMTLAQSQASTIVPGNAVYDTFTASDRQSSPRIVHPHHHHHQQHLHHRRQQQHQQQEFRERQTHIPIPEGLTLSQQQQHVAQQQALRHSVNIPGREQASPGSLSGVLDGRASPRGAGSVLHMSQNRLPFQGPVPAPPPPLQPLQPAPVQLQLQTPITPGSRAGLHVQLAESNVPGAPSPAIVYAYPQGGYMMALPQGLVQTPRSTRSLALPPGLVQTPRSTRSQAYQRWDPYECVSPSGDGHNGGHTGFRSNYRNKDDAATVSLEGSPATCSSTGDTDTSADSSATICSDTTSTADIDDSATFKPLSSLSDVIERGFHGEEKPLDKLSETTAEVTVMPLTDKNTQETVFETPRRVQRVSITDGGAACGDDKENARSKIGVVGGGKKLGDSSGNCVPEETLSGSKRGGDEIAKQKSFTGSYFQVSPSSFLKPNKRQRNLV